MDPRRDINMQPQGWYPPQQIPPYMTQPPQYYNPYAPYQQYPQYQPYFQSTPFQYNSQLAPPATYAYYPQVPMPQAMSMQVPMSMQAPMPMQTPIQMSMPSPAQMAFQSHVPLQISPQPPLASFQPNIIEAESLPLEVLQMQQQVIPQQLPSVMPSALSSVINPQIIQPQVMPQAMSAQAEPQTITQSADTKLPPLHISLPSASPSNNLVSSPSPSNAESTTKKTDKLSHKKENGVYRCHKCERTYLSYPALYTHNKIKHPPSQGGSTSKLSNRGRPKKNVLFLIS